MKILIASSYADSWNSVRPEAEIFIRMAKLGHTITIATESSSEYVPRFREHGIKVIDCYPKHKICWQTIKTIRTELVQGKYDIVYAMTSRTIPNAAFACSNLPVKLVTYRGTMGGLSRYDPSAYLTHLHPGVDGIICIADAVSEVVRKQVWIAKEQVVTVYKGHDMGWYKTARADLTEFAINNDDFVAICVANARPVKGIEVLLEASHLLASHEKLHLLFVGKNFDKEPYYSLIAASPMKNRIHVAGYRNDVPALVGASNMIVLPSIADEGLPKTIIEGMALAIPSVVTSAGGCKELVVDDQTGFIVSPGSAEELADKILTLYADKEKARTMGKKARERVENIFTLENSVTEHLDFFSKLITQNE